MGGWGPNNSRHGRAGVGQGGGQKQSAGAHAARLQSSAAATACRHTSYQPPACSAASVLTRTEWGLQGCRWQTAARLAHLHSTAWEGARAVGQPGSAGRGVRVEQGGQTCRSVRLGNPAATTPGNSPPVPAQGIIQSPNKQNRQPDKARPTHSSKACLPVVSNSSTVPCHTTRPSCRKMMRSTAMRQRQNRMSISQEASGY